MSGQPTDTTAAAAPGASTVTMARSSGAKARGVFAPARQVPSASRTMTRAPPNSYSNDAPSAFPRGTGAGRSTSGPGSNSAVPSPHA